MGLLLNIMNHVERLGIDPALRAGSDPLSPGEIRQHIAGFSKGMNTPEFYNACTHFYSMPRFQAVPALISALENLHPQIKRSAAVMLSLLDAREAAKPIMGLFKSDVFTVRYAAMCTLFWFGKSAIPCLYDNTLKAKSSKIAVDSLATILAIAAYAPRKYNAGSECLLNGEPLTIADRRSTVGQMSSWIIHDRTVEAQAIFSEINGGPCKEPSLLNVLQRHLDDAQLIFIGKQINRVLVPEHEEKLPRPKVLRLDFKRSRKRVLRTSPRKPPPVLAHRRRGPTNKT
ncbi:hypothetical protein GF412_04265 [Candidatus Micrarchaeota archaeon]|nr:hypothetical protein [Candidatus Micrarchaeota archaeon]MBD3418165.1 hypothetical protein [Candidatus Micrarchaeota archaeon]